MDSCRVKDNHSPWPVQAHPLLISSQLSSAQSQPQLQLGLRPSGWHVTSPTHTLTRIYTHTHTLVIFVLIFECLIQKPLHKCKVDPCVFTRGNPEIHLTRVTCQNLFLFCFVGVKHFAVKYDTIRQKQEFAVGPEIVQLSVFLPPLKLLGYVCAQVWLDKL